MVMAIFAFSIKKNFRIAADAHDWQQKGGAPPAGSHVSTAPTAPSAKMSKNRKKKMKQKAKKQQAMLKKVEEQMLQKDDELQKRLVSLSKKLGVKIF